MTVVLRDIDRARVDSSKPCVTCGQPTEVRCDWPADKPTRIWHGSLDESDVVVTRMKKLHLPVLTVRRFFMWRRLLAGEERRHSITMFALEHPKNLSAAAPVRHWLYFHWGKQTVTVVRRGRCEAPCCEFHQREVGDNRHYCRDHWELREVAA